MNRVNRKFKLDSNRSSFDRNTTDNGSRIHSGHYMTSCLNDQNEDTVEMPIASPDATNNDVTLNTNLNIDTETDSTANQVLINSNKTQVLSNISVKNSNINNYIAKKNILNGQLTKIQEMIISNGSISGGLTLDKTNKSLKNLMFYIRSAYSNNLTSPKWKSFKGLKLQVTEKIRLNNVIWRSWFEQYGKKDTTNVKLRLICQFANGLEEKPAFQKMSKREGKFWKARLESITNEYKKWREISRKQIKATCEVGEILKPKQIYRGPTHIQPITQSSTPNAQQLSSSLSETTYIENHLNFQPNFNNQNQNYLYSSNNFNVNEYQTDFNVQSNLQTESNFSSYGPNTPQNINNFNNFNIPSNYPSNNYHMNNVTTTSSYSTHPPIASKQMPYNNRCRSPSPGLFDFDFNNFSSDTLFSTHLIEDHKDPIFGTNPDLLQPDLMHLFPNFDFFDLPGNNNDLFRLNSDVNSEQNSPQAANSTTQTNDNSNNNFRNNNQIANFNSQPNENIKVVEVEEVNEASAIAIPIGFSDLSNFNTLATVAAAQSINVSPQHQQQNTSPQNNRPIRQRHMSDMGDFNHLKNSTEPIILDDVNNHLKMPVSLSQINTSLNINPIQNQYSLNTNNTISSTSAIRRSSGSQIQTTTNNSSSNTIRNLLALNTPAVPLAPISPPKQPNSNNMRISGILGASGSALPSMRKQNAPQKVIYPQETIPNLAPQQNMVKNDNLTISNLLTSNINIPLQSQQAEIQISVSQSEQFIDPTKPPPNKRGRKSTIVNGDVINQRSNSKTNSNKQNSQKLKKDDALPSPQINNNVVLPEPVDNLNTPTSSPNFPNYNNSFQIQNSDSNFSDHSSKFRNYTTTKSESNFQAMNGRINRSDSLNSLNTDASLSTAEQKRRCNIQQGFDRLQILVPALKEGKNLKCSKAVMLQKTSEYIKELQTARDKRMADLDVYKKEIEELSVKITECQNQLPANGVAVVGNLNKTEIFEQKFNSYIKEKTMANWKFYLFSLILKPLFDNFITSVNTSSKEDMERTFYEWQQNYCSLAQLRPIASNALRHLSRTTSILSDYTKLPQECISAALNRI
ncbi:unnamed protein product [Brachionus calyciflorus]|uniref:BHLH domain-containing protein n=1 Tax=Brachionus calyciflorus TaxID=104777 RepID=A0A814FZB8_9BILA|nr:unnamed protein product [Brachionus calyciflorus]